MSIFNYDIKSILKDLVLFRISIKSIKTLLKISKLISDIDSNRVRPKDLMKFKPNDIRIALKFHNKYIVKGEKYNVEFVLTKINDAIRRVNMMRTKYPEISNAINGLVIKRIQRNRY